MAKGYWIARMTVDDPEAYKGYVEAGKAAFAKYGAKFLVRGGAFTAPEGTPRDRNVVIEFEDYETALACYNSPEYQAAREKRRPVSEGELILVHGYDGPQP
ncbi:DUF1330 domain-containing protein [Rhodobium gokarnense]|uniref:Uncharacterized protein (DUF1330 family) n=1 Tax=Rhodobium gokarnense TaxID=364296 RepID=A0ABT3HE67_9HYPH|nr:DUF1330 domain-containing protein [Rhodobium gokarnense]MCW2308693.1 uncharacterized protein (DUF1330 family) [Rhodobium gokarnense]